MKKIIQGNHYEIVSDFYNTEQAKKIIIAMHGFAGDKESSCIAALRERMAENGFGLVTFDWPAHGESPVDGRYLRVSYCQEDLKSVCEHIRRSDPGAELYAFATSFGGYQTLLYYHSHPETFRKIFLRSPALHMSEVMEQILADTCETEEGWTTGFDRRILVTRAFRADLKEYDLERLFDGYLFDRNVTILHGDADDLVPYTDSVNFCREHGIRLLTAAGTDHRYKKTGELDRVIDLAERFFTEGTGI